MDQLQDDISQCQFSFPTKIINIYKMYSLQESFMFL